ncbi:MAG: hypothetical protein HDT32_06600 [Clostridiales bacterium]|nr:hypothetical protein [Clostridiales bacterium]
MKKRASAVIKTNNRLQFFNKNVLFMPDYYYSENEYARYKCEKQDNKVACLGQNNEYKKIIPLIKKFKDSKYQLVIRGKFFQEEVYQEAVRLSEGCSNIVIENNNVSEEVYYHELASSKYCALPYDTDFYFERTTGVGIEAMFLDSIVIGPKEILQFNDIKGIEYNSIEDLDLDLLDKDNSDILDNYESKRQNEYSESKTKQVISEAIDLAMSKVRQN